MEQLITLIGMVAQFVIGMLVARYPGTKDFVRKMIPVLGFVISLATQILAAANASVPAGVQPAAAGFFGTFGKGFVDILANALIQTLFVTGFHSAPKNVVEGVKLILKG